MKAYPTLYRGIQFRSRLEAKWAAFFDNLGWPWEYEPIDLDGYIPDFILTFPYAPLLVEVKPVLEFEELEQYTQKIDKSGWDKEALIVGAKLFKDDKQMTEWGIDIIGLLGELCWDADTLEENTRDWGPGGIHICDMCGSISITHGFMGYHCRVAGCYDGPRGKTYIYSERFWADACNKVQYFPKG